MEPRKRKSITAFSFSPSICHEVMGLDAMIIDFSMWVLSQLFHYLLSPSRSFHPSRSSLIPLHFLPLEWYHLHIWSERKWKWKWSCSVLSDSLRPHGFYLPYQVPLLMGFSRQSTGVGCHFLLHIWSYWYFSWQSWFQLVIHPAIHFSWCTLHKKVKYK